MAKEYDSKRRVAKHMYVHQGKTAKEIAEVLSVAQKTIGEWVKKYNWREEKNSREVAPQKRRENLEKIFDDLAKDRIRLVGEIEAEEKMPQPDSDRIMELRKQIAQIDDGAAKWNKRFLSAEKESSVSPAQYIQVMDQIFEAIARYDYTLYQKLLDFQDLHLCEISNRKTI